MVDRDDTQRDVSRKRVLFISHLHTDQAAADVLREFIETWTAGRVAVFLSSSGWGSGPRIGRRLTDDLKTALREAEVVTLLHTRPEDDWSTCLWEVGVATGPDKPDTNVVLLEAGEEIPPVFDDRVRVNLRRFVDIQRFVEALLTSADFFPTFQEAVTEFQPRTEPVLRAAQHLYSELQRVLPVMAEDPGHSWATYPFMTLQLTFDHVLTIEQAQPPDRLAQTLELLENHSLVVRGDTEVGRVFGMHEAPQAILFKRLIAAWRETTTTPESKWLEGLATQVMDAALSMFPTLRWELLRGADKNDGTWYGPAVVSVRRIPAGRVLELDVSLCKFAVDGHGAVVVGVAPLEAPGT